MNWVLLSVSLVTNCALLAIVFFLLKKFSAESQTSVQILEKSQEHSQVLFLKMMEQNTSLLNRLQSHNWQEFSSLQIASAPQVQTERVNPDEAYFQTGDHDDHWGEYEPPESLKDTISLLKEQFDVLPG